MSCCSAVENLSVCFYPVSLAVCNYRNLSVNSFYRNWPVVWFIWSLRKLLAHATSYETDLFLEGVELAMFAYLADYISFAWHQYHNQTV